ncbi:MAG: EAL domain-containing protein [Candidatus Neomarinimicrobiota bacterium]|nr:MAG: EAL domain-containing protein [Candidatus Neomarinimicrobiota bacterium]
MRELEGLFNAFLESSQPDEVLACCVASKIGAQTPREIIAILQDHIRAAISEEPSRREQRFKDLGYRYYQSGSPIVNIIAILNFFHQGFLQSLADTGLLNRYFNQVNEFFNELKNDTTKGYLHKDLDELEFVFMSEFKNREALSPHMKWVQTVAQAIRSDNPDLLDAAREMKQDLDEWLSRPETLVLLGDEQDWVRILHNSIEQLVTTLAQDYPSRNYLQMFILAKEIGKKTLYFLHTLNDLYLSFLENREKRFVEFIYNAMAADRLSHVAVLYVKNLEAMTRIWGEQVRGMIQERVAEAVSRATATVSVGAFVMEGQKGRFYIFFPDRYGASLVGPVRKLKKQLEDIAFDFEGNTIAFRATVACVGFLKGESLSRDLIQKLISFITTKADLSQDAFYNLEAKEKKPVIESIIRSYKEIQFIQNTLNEKNLELFFQPVVEMESREVYNLEALARIVTPDAIISAKEFIQTVYDLGMILKLDSLVFELIRDYRDKIREVTDKIFLNVSPFSLKSANFRNILNKTVAELKRVGLTLTIELTEQAILENVDVIRFINEHYGVKFAIDDFGTGYSSLYTVASLSQSGAVAYLKVDGEMIRGMESSPETFKVVNTIVNMSYALRLQTIPEYVENEQIATRLMEMGCKIGQGNYFCPPSPIDSIRNL